MPQPPQLVLPGRSSGSARSARVWASPPSRGSCITPTSTKTRLGGALAARRVVQDLLDRAPGGCRRRRGRPCSSAPRRRAPRRRGSRPTECRRAPGEVAVEHRDVASCRRGRGAGPPPGSGRKSRTRSAPTLIPRSRAASTAARTVLPVVPIETTPRSRRPPCGRAPPRRRAGGRTRPRKPPAPRGRPPARAPSPPAAGGGGPRSRAGSRGRRRRAACSVSRCGSSSGGRKRSTAAWSGISVGIIVCERTKASWQTITGSRTRGSSASR